MSVPEPQPAIDQDAAEMPAGSSVSGLTPSSERDRTPETAESESGRETAALELARVFDSEAMGAESVPLAQAGEILHRRNQALIYAFAAVDAGFRRVSVDDDTGGLTEDEARDVAEALHCVEADGACHWPTVAGILAAEVRRLRVAVQALRDGSGT